MKPDARHPVLVGVAQVTQRSDDHTECDEAVDLMALAAREAAADCGSPSILERVQWIGVPDGTWDYRDPARMVANRMGHPDPTRPHTVLADVGVLQHQLWHRAASLISDGHLDVALVVGGEARFRAGCARRAGVELADAEQDPSVEPDERWTTDDVGISPMEMERGLHQPASAYALMESAIGHAAGRSAEDHRHDVAELWVRFASVAAANPSAWDRAGHSASTIADVTDANRMISSPYAKLMCSQWNVNQAAALILCSVEAAEQAGIPRDRWVFPHVITENRLPEAVTQRPQLHRLFGARVASERLLELAGLASDDIDLLDIYSCFPAAVQIYSAELGIPLDRELTVTGGLTFGGGPLNNYTLQSTAEMARRLREQPDAKGLVTTVSAFLSKQGYDLWSATPPERGYRFEDCTESVRSRVEVTRIDPERGGDAEIVAWTVEHSGGEPWQALVVAEFPDGARTLLTSQDHGVLDDMSTGDWVGRTVSASPDGTFQQ